MHRHDIGECLAEIREDGPAETDATDDGGQAVIQENDVRGLARDVRAALAHRDADVGGLERRRVVDSVAGHDQHFTVRLERLHQRELLFRQDAGEDAHPPDPLPEGGERERGDLGSAEHAGSGVDAGLAGNRERGRRIVAGDHRDIDSGAPRARERLRNIRAQRV